MKNNILIKKYPNRRLYNTEISSYITLNDLFHMVKKGIDFIVIDSKSNENITKTILMQIIFEQETKSYNLLPNNFLRQIIYFYNTPEDNIMAQYLEMMINSFNKNQNDINKLAINHMEIFENNLNLLYKSFNLNKKEE